MARLLKYSEWENAKMWHCNDTTNLCSIAAKWYTPARMLNMSLTDYVLMLKNEYKAEIKGYYPKTDILIYGWKNYSDAHKFVLFINREARKRNFLVD